MDIEKIDMVLIDHALGATAPEVGALVEAFVEMDIEARARLEQFCATAGSAKRALVGDAELPPLPRTLPCFAGPLVEPRKRWMSSQAQRAALWMTGIAACVAVGFFAGARVALHMDSPKTIARITSPGARAEPENNATPSRVAAVQNFWSISRLQARAAENTIRADSSRSDWTNFLTNPWQRAARFGG